MTEPSDRLLRDRPRTSDPPTLPEVAPSEEVFSEPWEAQAFALVVSLNERRLFTWSEWSEAVASAPEEGYYERWLATLERLLAERGVVDEGALERYRHAWEDAAARTPHGTPIELSTEDFR